MGTRYSAAKEVQITLSPFATVLNFVAVSGMLRFPGSLTSNGAADWPFDYPAF